MLRSVLVLISMVCLSAPSYASIIYSATGLGGAFTTQNFDVNAGNGTLAGSQFAGITFSAGLYVNNFYNGVVPNMVNSSITNFQGVSPPIVDPTTYSFSSDLTDLAFALYSNPQTTTVSTFLNGGLIETVALSTGISGNYVVIGGYTFDQVLLTSTGSNDAYVIDDMQYKVASFAAVPEPSSFALIGAIGAFGVWKRRRSQKVA